MGSGVVSRRSHVERREKEENEGGGVHTPGMVMVRDQQFQCMTISSEYTLETLERKAFLRKASSVYSAHDLCCYQDIN